MTSAPTGAPEGLFFIARSARVTIINPIYARYHQLNPSNSHFNRGLVNPLSTRRYQRSPMTACHVFRFENIQLTMIYGTVFCNMTKQRFRIVLRPIRFFSIEPVKRFFVVSA